MNMSKNKTNRFMPFIMAFCVVIGIIIGTFFSNHFSGNRLNVINSGSNRLNNLLHLIDDQYVDPLPNERRPMMVARSLSCMAPAKISADDAEPSLMRTTIGIFW